MKNYPDYFASIGKTMLKKADGSGYVLVTDSELTLLFKSNRIALEIPTSMGGKVRDLTQKPIMVLKNEKNEWENERVCHDKTGKGQFQKNKSSIHINSFH